MNQDDRNAIDQLFEKLREVELRSTPRDPEAEARIRQRIAEQPGAPYYMAQTIVVQEQALEMARRQLETLERQANPPGLFGGLFGGGQRNRQPVRSVPTYRQGYAPGGGGFLAGAAQTALGVAGGVILADMLTGAFSADPAEAAEAGAEGADMGGGDSGDFDGGGDF